MMKRMIGWSAVLALWAVPTVALADSPWGSADQAWNGSFLSSNRYYTARRMDDAPKAPAVDASSIPSPTEASAPSAAPTPIANEISQSLDGYSASGPLSLSDVGGGCPDCGCTTGDCDCGSGSCSLGGCGSGGCCGSRWFGGVYGLYMNRRNNFPTYLSYDSAAPFPPALTTNSTGNHFNGGVETWIGRYLNDCWGVAIGYWGFFPGVQTARAYDSYYSGDLSSAIGYTGLSYNNGVNPNTLDYWYGAPNNPAAMHQLTRSFEAHNFELNFIRNPYRKAGPVHYELLAGFRYLKLSDGLIFSTDRNNTVLNDDPNNELHHIIDVKNNLVGFQVGGRADRYFGSRFGVHLGSKLGIYNNHITHFQRICGGNGNAYITGTTTDYYMDTSVDKFAVAGELYAGGSYQLGNAWSLTGGYRAISACGVGLATSQFPREREFVSVSRSGQINSGDCLLLHGAYFGAQYCW